jgi:hypothetical protein
MHGAIARCRIRCALIPIKDLRLRRGTMRRMKSVQAEIDALLDHLFRDAPALVGFSVLDAAALEEGREAGQLQDDLYLADLATAPWLGDEPEDRLFGEIAVALIDFMDERPEARELLRGRTFARTLH